MEATTSLLASTPCICPRHKDHLCLLGYLHIVDTERSKAPQAPTSALSKRILQWICHRGRRYRVNSMLLLTIDNVSRFMLSIPFSMFLFSMFASSMLPFTV